MENSEKSAPIVIDQSAVRTQLALDRTLLAWVRTGLTLIGCGFTLAKYVHTMMSKGTIVGMSENEPRIIGLSLMSLGVFGLISAIVHYIQNCKRLKFPPSAWSSSLVVAIGLVVMAFWMIGSILKTLNGV